MQLLALFIAHFLSYSPGLPASRSDTAHSGLGLPRSTINQENTTRTCPQVSLMEADAQLNDIFPHDLRQVDRNELAHLHSPPWLISTQPRLPSPAPWASRPCPESQLPPFNTCTSAPSPGSWCPLCSMGNLHIAVLVLNGRKNQYRSFIPASGDSPNPSTFMTGTKDHLYCRIGFCPESTQAPEPQERQKSAGCHAFHLDLC